MPRTNTRTSRRIAQPPGLAPLPPDPAFAQARLDFAAAAYPDSLEARFQRYERDNPQVYAEFRAIAQEMYDRGVPHFSADAIYQVMRYHRAVRGYEPGNDWGLNNNYRSRHARKLVAENPAKWAGFFSFRLLRSA